MKRIIGIAVLLLVVYLATWIMADAFSSRAVFMSGYNQENLLRRIALYGILGIGVSLVTHHRRDRSSRSARWFAWSEWASRGSRWDMGGRCRSFF